MTYRRSTFVFWMLTLLAAPRAFAEEPANTEGASVEAASERTAIDGVVGHIGFGYFTGSAPLGLRYWFDRTSAFDLGVDAAFSSGGVTAQRYGVELGYVHALACYHYSVVFTRLGIGTRYLDTGEAEGVGQWDVNGNAFLGAELFLGAFGFPNVSLQGGYGLQTNYTVQGGSAFTLAAVNAGLSVVGSGNVGFHIYW